MTSSAIFSDDTWGCVAIGCRPDAADTERDVLAPAIDVLSVACAVRNFQHSSASVCSGTTLLNLSRGNTHRGAQGEVCCFHNRLFSFFGFYSSHFTRTNMMFVCLVTCRCHFCIGLYVWCVRPWIDVWRSIQICVLTKHRHCYSLSMSEPFTAVVLAVKVKSLQSYRGS